MFPITPSAMELLDELSERKEKCGIVSEFVFCNEKGEHLRSEKFKEVFCDRSTLGLPENVIPFNKIKSPRTANPRVF